MSDVSVFVETSHATATLGAPPMTWEELKILLIRMNMSVTDLAREIHCSRPSVYMAFTQGGRPRVLKKIEQFYEEHSKRLSNPPRGSAPSNPPEDADTSGASAE
jgi:hypothetical protein